ncbi:glycoside hydrolase family 13 protein [Bacillus solimangrovi]|uniref:Alpha-glycosidase n=1 Tax=Bacillus solimangrovi TaxID=1305675 RepID=A0A1E5LC32_9BACI|nr:glycoside hydrolase family 13 protein [Bacillus solimangrovi]OEH91658.1 alpha-glycosidase [Bacillus solimangrovi]
MDKAAIYHRTDVPYLYGIDQQTIEIKLRSKKGDLTDVTLVYGDPYDWHEGQWQNTRKKMNIIGSDQLFDYWVCKVKPTFKRLRYVFEVCCETEQWTYTEKGFYQVTTYDDTSYYFAHPYLHQTEQFHAPSWVKDTIWYQIFPERFANGDSTINPPNTENWGSQKPTFDNFFGGDLQGIINHIDYLEKLGITGIYLTPIFLSPSNHKYNTTNYREIDPHFGDKEILKALITMCHERGIRIILDAVFNHCGKDFPLFIDVKKHGSTSPYYHWFHTHQSGYETFAFEDSMPKFNTTHPDVKKYLIDIACAWTKEFQIDGWRLDVANEVDHSFWREFRVRIKEINPEAYIVGEVWHDALPWLRGDQFDSVMNYPLSMLLIHYFGQDKIDAQNFQGSITSLLQMYPPYVNDVLMNIISSHDTQRVLNVCNGELEKVKLMYLFFLSYPGSPCIYYGEEIGMSGGADPDCRACMVWDESKQNLDMYNFIQKCTFFRHTLKPFGSAGKFQFIPYNHIQNTIVYEKITDDEKLLFFINSANEPVEITVPMSTHYNTIQNIWTNEDACHLIQGNQLTVKVNALDFIVLHFQ